MRSITMKRVLGAFSITMIALFSLPLHADDISGTYKCSGYDPFVKASYNADLTVSKTGDTYRLQWGTGGKDFAGTGMISKQFTNAIAAEYWNPSNQNNSGVILYKIQPDNTLEGDWTVSDQSMIGNETCKKQTTTQNT